MRRHSLIASLAVAGALIVPAAASAKIVLNSTIAGVGPGQTMTKVKSILGKPHATSRGKTEFGTVTTYFYDTSALQLDVQFLAGRVVRAETRDAGQRTSGGLGVGSSYAKVRAAFKTERCVKPASYLRNCTVGGRRPGQKATTFRIIDNKVQDISIGIVID